MKSQDRKILVVEDDDVVRGVFARGLRRAGFQVVEESGREPISFESTAPLDACVCDVALPIENGNSIAERCRSAFPDCAVVLLSGHSADEIRAQGTVTDAEVIQKPVGPQEVVATVLELLTRTEWRKLRTDE